MKIEAKTDGADRFAECLTQFAELTGLEVALREAARQARGARRRLRDDDGMRAAALGGSLAIEPTPDAFAIGLPSEEEGIEREFRAPSRPARPWLAPAWDTVPPQLQNRLRLFLFSALRSATRA